MADELDLDQEGIGGDEDGIGNLSEATEAELVAQDSADQEQGASQTEPDEDFLAQEFEYEAADGTKTVLTGEQLLEAQERADALEAKVKELEAKGTEKPAEAKPAGQMDEDMAAIAPVEWDKVGENFASMLEGEDGGHGAIGPALQNVVLRTIATDPFIADVVGRYIDFRVSQREQGSKAETSFKEFVGDDISEADVEAFRKDNPWATTKKEAVLGIKAARVNQEVAALKSGKPKEVEAAKKKGEKEALIRAKARGTLRPLTGQKGGRPGSPVNLAKKFDITDTEERSQAMAEFIKNRRASGKT